MKTTPTTPTTPRHALSRRAVLRGAYGGATLSVALPRLSAMLDGNGMAYASGEPLPRRFGVVGMANGVFLNRWVPKDTGPAFTLSEEIKPLETVKEYVTVVSGTDLPFDGRGHCAAHTVFMTGALPGGASDDTYTARHASIDQVVAKTIGAGTRFRSLQVGVDGSNPPEKGTSFHAWSHNGPNSPNLPVRSCSEVFKRLFVGGGVTAPDAAAAEAAARLAMARKSVLDLVLEDSRDLLFGLGQTDKQRLEQHFEGIRAIEKRLVPSGPLMAGTGCTAPGAPADALAAGSNYEDRGPLINKTMAELVALALACDLTRVFTYQLLTPGSRIKVGSLGVTNQYHAITHDSGKAETCHKMVVYFVKELSVIVEALRAVREGAGSLLDSCGIAVTNDCTDGRLHNVTNWPMLVIGRAGGKLRAGIHYRSTSRENSLRVPLTVARAVGANLPTFGTGKGETSEDLGGILV